MDACLEKWTEMAEPRSGESVLREKVKQAPYFDPDGCPRMMVCVTWLDACADHSDYAVEDWTRCSAGDHAKCRGAGQGD